MDPTKKAVSMLSKDRMAKILASVKKDLDDELVRTNKRLEEIDQKIYTCITNLNRLRKSVVISHYSNIKTKNDAQQIRKRNAILKNLDSEDEARDLSVFMTNLAVKSNQNDEPTSNVEEISKPILQNPLPSTSFVFPTGLIDLTFIIGNTVKISGSDQEMKYKWTVYVRNPEEGIDNLIYIDKVTYFLHESYEPNHIVDVIQKPFSLTRHGWGEFVVRLRLCFKGNMNVQTDVYHKLSLDKESSVGIPMVAREQTVRYKLLLHK